MSGLELNTGVTRYVRPCTYARRDKVCQAFRSMRTKARGENCILAQGMSGLELNTGVTRYVRP
jgi:hypothetical protein